jgi:hypothetical protein
MAVGVFFKRPPNGLQSSTDRRYVELDTTVRFPCIRTVNQSGIRVCLSM